MQTDSAPSGWPAAEPSAARRRARRAPVQGAGWLGAPMTYAQKENTAGPGVQGPPRAQLPPIPARCSTLGSGTDPVPGSRAVPGCSWIASAAAGGGRRAGGALAGGACSLLTMSGLIPERHSSGLRQRESREPEGELRARCVQDYTAGSRLGLGAPLAAGRPGVSAGDRGAHAALTQQERPEGGWRGRGRGRSQQEPGAPVYTQGQPPVASEPGSCTAAAGSPAAEREPRGAALARPRSEAEQMLLRR